MGLAEGPQGATADQREGRDTWHHRVEALPSREEELHWALERAKRQGKSCTGGQAPFHVSEDDEALWRPTRRARGAMRWLLFLCPLKFTYEPNRAEAEMDS